MASFKAVVVMAASVSITEAATCCYDDGLTKDQCATASDCDGAGDYCSASVSQCSDCGGVFCSDSPAPAPEPTPVPSPEPTPVPSPSPAPGGEAKCCYDDGLTKDQCATASDCDGAGDYCSASESQCGDCGGVFCATSPTPSPPEPTPAPTPAPSPSPAPGGAKCCYDDGLTPDQCATASDCDDSSDYCSASTSQCSDCGGVFCSAQPEPAPSPAPTPVGKTFKCVDGQCVPGIGGIDRKTCKSLCAPVTTYKCVNNQCVQSEGGATQEVCESFCGSQVV